MTFLFFAKVWVKEGIVTPIVNYFEETLQKQWILICLTLLINLPQMSRYQKRPCHSISFAETHKKLQNGNPQGTQSRSDTTGTSRYVSLLFILALYKRMSMSPVISHGSVHQCWLEDTFRPLALFHTGRRLVFPFTMLSVTVLILLHNLKPI